jgi:hypothetical protein
MLRAHTHTHGELWIVPSPHSCMGCLSYSFFRNEFLLSLPWKPLFSHIALYYCLMSSKWNYAPLLTEVPRVHHTVFHPPASSFLYQYKLAYSPLCGPADGSYATAVGCWMSLRLLTDVFWLKTDPSRSSERDREGALPIVLHSSQLFCFCVVFYDPPYPTPLYLSAVTEDGPCLGDSNRVSRDYKWGFPGCTQHCNVSPYFSHRFTMITYSLNALDFILKGPGCELVSYSPLVL